MASSLSNLVNNLSEGIHRIKCPCRYDDKKCETCRIKYKYLDCFLEYTNFKDDLIEYKCLCCNKIIYTRRMKNLKNRLKNMTIMSLFYFCEKVFIFMNICMIEKNSMKHHYLKRRFLQSLKYGRCYWCRLCTCKKNLQRFWNKNLREYHNFYVQSDTLFLADVDVEDPEVDVQYLGKLHELHNDLTF